MRLHPVTHRAEPDYPDRRTFLARLGAFAVLLGGAFMGCKKDPEPLPGVPPDPGGPGTEHPGGVAPPPTPPPEHLAGDVAAPDPQDGGAGLTDPGTPPEHLAGTPPPPPPEHLAGEPVAPAQPKDDTGTKPPVRPEVPQLKGRLRAPERDAEE
jgi:hypothetical protein